MTRTAFSVHRFEMARVEKSAYSSLLVPPAKNDRACENDYGRSRYCGKGPPRMGDGGGTILARSAFLFRGI